MAYKNALIELAVDMQVIRDGTFNPAYRESADKAMRIVAELAKVSEGSWVEDCGGKVYLCRLESRVVETAVGKCRAIAEEGLK